MRGILVTGATTPIGTGIVEALLSDAGIGHVLAVGLEPPDSFPISDPARLTYLQADLTRSREIRQLLFAPARDRHVDTVIHTALHRGATTESNRVHALNVEATRELLHLCERHPTIRCFILRSAAEVYRVRAWEPNLIGEDHPLDLSPHAPQWVRDRVEADLCACTRMGMAPLRILVLRCAECLAPGTGSQLYDYLQSRVCFQPMGYDPMLNLMSVADMVRAVQAALRHAGQGIFNIPGRDTLPLSKAIRCWGRTRVPAPGLMLGPLYRMRTLALNTDFRYDLNQFRFHFSAVLDGRRAREELGYEPQTGIAWPAYSADTSAAPATNR